MEGEAMEISSCSEEETPLCLLDCDPAYEFDAPRFFDFTRSETPSEEEEAQRWFDHASSYPVSPFVAKLRSLPVSLNDVEKARDTECPQDRHSINNDAATEEDGADPGINPCHDDADQHLPLRAAAKLRPHSYMKPTASYLAKQNQSQQLQFHRILRSRNVSDDYKTSSSSSCSSEILTTKRQKLDIGFLQKVIHAKQRSPLQHKGAKMERKPDDWTLGRPKVTVPREFSLETARRAMRHRGKKENISTGKITSSFQASNACVSNHKDVKAPASKPPLPVDLFKKLSIDTQVQPIPRPIEMLEAATEKPLRSSAKQFQCARDMSISDHRPQASFNRSLDIR